MMTLPPHAFHFHYQPSDLKHPRNRLMGRHDNKRKQVTKFENHEEIFKWGPLLFLAMKPPLLPASELKKVIKSSGAARGDVSGKNTSSVSC